MAKPKSRYFIELSSKTKSTIIQIFPSFQKRTENEYHPYIFCSFVTKKE